MKVIDPSAETAKARSVYTMLDSARTHFPPRSEVVLYSQSEGYVPAGAGVRYTDGYYGVRWLNGAAYYGRQFKVRKEAEEFFAEVKGGNS